MPGKDKGLVGIELCPGELRAVYVHRHGNRAEVVAASHVRMPSGGLVAGLVQQPTAVSVALRLLLDEMRVPAGVGVVMGIPSEGVVVRSLNVPPSPDEELATIVAGEVDHYRILRTRGSHDYITLDPPTKAAPGAQRSVLVAAAEEVVTKALGSLAIQTGVRLVALEPVEFGLLRSAATALGGEDSAFAILIGQYATDLAAFSKGRLCFYRRAEYGFRNLVTSGRSATPPSFAGESVPPDGDPSKYNPAVLDALCSEIGRSVDYIKREFKEFARFETLSLSVSEAELADIGHHLTERLGTQVEILPPCAGPVSRGTVPAQMNGPEGMRYSAAFGLAMRDFMVASGALPRVDLYAVDRAETETQVTRRNLTGSYLTSGLAIALGIAGFVLYGGQATQVESTVTATKTRVESLIHDAEAATEKHRARDRQIGLLSAGGIAATALMDLIATSLDPDCGVQAVSVAPDRTVLITAEARSEISMLRTVQNVRRIPILQSVMVQTFTNSAETGRGLTFTMTAKTLPLSEVRIKLAPGDAGGIPTPEPGEPRIGGLNPRRDGTTGEVTP